MHRAARPGNGAVEGGFVAPIVVTLPAKWQLTLDPEVDILANAAGAGRHANIANLASLSAPLNNEFTGSVEIWTATDFDPSGRRTQASADLALAWIPTKRPSLQLDAGVNLGLNARTPGVQFYAGVAKRF